MRRVLAMLLVVYLVALGGVTLGPDSTPSKAVEETATKVDGATESDRESKPPTQGQRSLTDTVLNVLLFVPFGSLVLGLWPSSRWWAVVVAGAGLSALIELSQLWVFTWRGAQLSDLVTNTAGAALGFVLAALVLRLKDTDGARGSAQENLTPGVDTGRRRS